MQAHEAELDADSLRFAIARRRERLSDYDERRYKFLQIVAKRAEWFAKHRSDVPGGETGLLRVEIKVVGGGPAAYTVEEYVPDIALSQELRALNKQAAQELGQWAERTELDQRVAQQVQIVERKVYHLPPRDLGDIEDAKYREEGNSALNRRRS
jgi:hypothetical protein